MATKAVYVSFLLHANMSYDRYTKQTIEQAFPRLYRAGVESLLSEREIPAVIDLSGITIRWLERIAPDILDGIRELAARGQVDIAGCQYACSVNANTDELTTLESCRLGMEIAREVLDPSADGFFCQEMSYHPQIPWVLGQIGARWTVLRGRRGEDHPTRVRGLDGSELDVAWQVYHGAGELLRDLNDIADGTYHVLGCDFEMLPDLSAVRDELLTAAGPDVEIRLTTVRAWLRERAKRPSAALVQPRGSGLPEPLELESFSRWVLKPRDIECRQQQLRAMVAVRRAGLLAGATGQLGSRPLEHTCEPVTDNPWDAIFEHAGDFAEDADRLGPRGCGMARALHRLLIGVNSDAIGWVPWLPRQLHREGELDRARIIADQVAREALVAYVPQTGVDGVHYAVFNPTRSREAIVEVETPLPCIADGLPVLVNAAGRNHRHLVRVPLPEYGITGVTLTPASPATPYVWAEGRAAVAGGVSVRVEAEGLTIERGALHAQVRLAPFELTDPTGVCETVTVMPNLASGECRVRNTPLGPELEVLCELAWPVFARVSARPYGDLVTLDVDLWFHQPRRVGQLGSYDPEGLRLDVTGTAGRLAYSVPFGVVESPNQDLCHAAMHRFACLDGPASGVAVFPVSGMQGLSAEPRDGRLGVRLGASALGELDAAPRLSIDARGLASHYAHSTGALFCGHYRHTVAVLLYEGTWRDANLPERGRQCQEPPYVVAVPARAESRCLLSIEPNHVDIAGLRTGRDGTEIVLCETFGRQAHARWRCGPHQGECVLGPWEVARCLVR